MQNAVLEEYILSIIQNNEISEQNDLQKILRHHGICISQATLSRKLRKLKITKISGLYKVMEFNPAYLPIVLNIQVSDYGLVVLRTNPGQANSLAYFLDQKYVTAHSENEILGTIAGDDTVLIITKNKESLEKILDTIYKDFPYLCSQEIVS
ncbi:MAG: hypothetical protein LBH38_00855 [Holosporales bacterium]|nr:hypothetical protein [Holosporales bacterium]